MRPLVFRLQSQLLALASTGQNLCSAFGLNNQNMQRQGVLSFLILESDKYHHCGPSTLLGTEDTAGGPSSSSCLLLPLWWHTMNPRRRTVVVKRYCRIFSSCSETTMQLESVMLPSKEYKKVTNTLYYCSQLRCQLAWLKFIFLMMRFLSIIPSHIWDISA